MSGLRSISQEAHDSEVSQAAESQLSEPAPPVALIDEGATAWILASTSLVLLMSLPGLAVFYGGFVRSKNVLSVLAQSLGITALSTVLWIAVGYSLAFTHGGPVHSVIGGFKHIFLIGVGQNTMVGPMGGNAPVPLVAHAAYQGSYAFLAPALFLGSVVERMRSRVVLIFGAVFLIVVYCPIAHMLWCPGGFLREWGVLDWAGGLVVGTTAGVAGLIASLMVGPRKGYPENVFRPHNTTLIVLGTGMLWTGWMGFEAGTGLHADGVAAMALMTTHSAGAFGALTWTGIEWLLHHGRPSILGFCAGAVAGLAAITPAAGYVGVGGSAVIGIVGSCTCYFMAVAVKEWAGWDETLDAFGVHATGGMTGTLLVAIFASPRAGGSGGNPEVQAAEDFSMGPQLLKQVTATVFVVLYSAIVSWLLLLALGKCWGLRVSAAVEEKGLDLAELDDGAYLFGSHHWEGKAFVTDTATSAARMVEQAGENALETLSESGDLERGQRSPRDSHGGGTRGAGGWGDLMGEWGDGDMRRRGAGGSGDEPGRKHSALESLLQQEEDEKIKQKGGTGARVAGAMAGGHGGGRGLRPGGSIQRGRSGSDHDVRTAVSLPPLRGSIG